MKITIVVVGHGLELQTEVVKAVMNILVIMDL